MSEIRARKRLDRHGGMSIPTNIVTLSVESILLPTDQPSAHEEEHFYACGLAGSSRSGDRSMYMIPRRLESTDQVWHALRSRTIRPRVCLVVCDGAVRCMTLLRLWGRIDSGELSLVSPVVAATSETGSVMHLAHGKPGSVILADPPTIVQVWCGTRRYDIVDVSNYTSVADWQDMPCERKAAVMLDLFSRWLEAWRESGIKRWAYTSAGLSWESWRAKEIPQTVEIHGDADALRLEREALYGGLCLARKVGVTDGPVTQLDVRGFYPSLMEGLSAPVQLDGVEDYAGAAPVADGGVYDDMIAECRIVSDTQPYPLRVDGDTHWVVGDFWTVLAGPELSVGIDAGHVRQLGKIARYKMGNIFDQWSKWVLESRDAARLKCDLASELLYKMVANSLWGKFAAHSESWVLDPSVTPPMRWGEWTHQGYCESCDTMLIECFDGSTHRVHCPHCPTSIKYRSLAGIVWRHVEPGEGCKSFPAIAAWICSAGRVRLWEHMRRVGLGNVLYVDTDGMIVKGAASDWQGFIGRPELIRPGMLRISDTGEDAEIVGPKRYRIGSEWHAAGLTRHAIEVDGHVMTTRKHSSAMSIVSSEDKGQYLSYDVPYSLLRDNVTGSVGPDGWVTPYRVIAPEYPS